jgi:hypothetical protein
VGHEALAIDHEFVAPRLTAEDGMIFEHQTSSARSVLAFKEESCGQSADAATHNHAIVLLAGVDDVGSKTRSRILCASVITSKVLPFEPP